MTLLVLRSCASPVMPVWREVGLEPRQRFVHGCLGLGEGIKLHAHCQSQEIPHRGSSLPTYFPTHIHMNQNHAHKFCAPLSGCIPFAAINLY